MNLFWTYFHMFSLSGWSSESSAHKNAWWKYYFSCVLRASVWEVSRAHFRNWLLDDSSQSGAWSSMMLILSHSQLTQQWPNIELSFELIFPSFDICVMHSVWRLKTIQTQTFSCCGMKPIKTHLCSAALNTRYSVFSAVFVSFKNVVDHEAHGITATFN